MGRVHFDEAVAADGVLRQPGSLDGLGASEVVAGFEVGRAKFARLAFDHEDGILPGRMGQDPDVFVCFSNFHFMSLYEICTQEKPLWRGPTWSFHNPWWAGVEGGRDRIGLT